MKFRHEDLDVWKLSLRLTKAIYQLSDSFPKTEEFGIKSQIRRAAVSISLNIAEGSGRYSKKEFAQFIRIAIGSLLETDTGLKISIELGYLQPVKYEKDISPIIQELYFKLIKLEKSLGTRK